MGFFGTSSCLASTGCRASTRVHSHRRDPTPKAICLERQVSESGHRSYWPVLGRWGSRDPIEELGCNNIYTFVQDNPINPGDMLGLLSISTDSGEKQVSIAGSGSVPLRFFLDGVGSGSGLFELSARIERPESGRDAWNALGTRYQYPQFQGGGWSFANLAVFADPSLPPNGVESYSMVTELGTQTQLPMVANEASRIVVIVDVVCGGEESSGWRRSLVGPSGLQRQVSHTSQWNPIGTVNDSPMVTGGPGRRPYPWIDPNTYQQRLTQWRASALQWTQTRTQGTVNNIWWQQVVHKIKTPQLNVDMSGGSGTIHVWFFYGAMNGYYSNNRSMQDVELTWSGNGGIPSVTWGTWDCRTVPEELRGLREIEGIERVAPPSSP